MRSFWLTCGCFYNQTLNYENYSQFYKANQTPMFRNLLLIFVLIPLTYCTSPQQNQQKLTGKVVRILDGDTFELLTEGNIPVKIRMNGIDAPEKNQAFGQKSKDQLAALCFGKNIEVLSAGTDRYNRVLGTAFTLSGLDINKEMIRIGMAWHYKEYSKDLELANAEYQAREARRGLWIDPSPIAPWAFRKNRKKKN